MMGTLRSTNWRVYQYGYHPWFIDPRDFLHYTCEGYMICRRYAQLIHVFWILIFVPDFGERVLNLLWFIIWRFFYVARPKKEIVRGFSDKDCK